MSTPAVTTALIIFAVLVVMIRLNRSPDFVIWIGLTLLVVVSNSLQRGDDDRSN